MYAQIISFDPDLFLVVLIVAQHSIVGTVTSQSKGAIGYNVTFINCPTITPTNPTTTPTPSSSANPTSLNPGSSNPSSSTPSSPNSSNPATMATSLPTTTNPKQTELPSNWIVIFLRWCPSDVEVQTLFVEIATHLKINVTHVVL